MTHFVTQLTLHVDYTAEKIWLAFAIERCTRSGAILRLICWPKPHSAAIHTPCHAGSWLSSVHVRFVAPQRVPRVRVRSVHPGVGIKTIAHVDSRDLPKHNEADSVVPNTVRRWHYLHGDAQNAGLNTAQSTTAVNQISSLTYK